VSPSRLRLEALRLDRLLLDERRRPRSLLRILVFALLVVGLGAGLGLILGILGAPTRTSTASGGMNPGGIFFQGAAAFGAVLLASVAVAAFLDRRPGWTVGLAAGRPAGRQVLLGAAAGASVPLLYALVLGLSGHLRFEAGNVAGLISTFALMLVGILLLSSMEELLLRGYVLQNLSVPFGPWPAVLVTGVLFGAAHAENPGADPEGVIFIALGGILLGWLAVRTASLWCVCAYHVAWNVTGGLVLGLTVSGMASPVSLLRGFPSGPEWLSGGAFGYESSWVTMAAELLTLGVAIRLAGPRLRHRENAAWYRRRWRGEPPPLWGPGSGPGPASPGGPRRLGSASRPGSPSPAEPVSEAESGGAPPPEGESS
jgi:membrane protease YdiL (CAAX protease family)